MLQVNDIKTSLKDIKTSLKDLETNVNKKFDHINEKFDHVDKKFDDVNKKIDTKFDRLMLLIIGGVILEGAFDFYRDERKDSSRRKEV